MALALLALCAAACERADVPRLVRLVDRVEPSVIAESPLLEPSPDAAVPARTVWAHDFEGDVVAEFDWPDHGGSDGVRTVPDPEHGQVVCLGADSADRFPILISARPLVRYRVTRVLKTDWPGLDLRVVESSTKLSHARTQAGRAGRRRTLADRGLGKSSAVAVHRFTSSAGNEWAEAELGFTTNLDTRTLGFVFEQVGDPSRPINSEACLARISLERLDPDPVQELALLRGAWAPPGDRSLGLVKRGRLLPQRRLRNTRPPYDENYEVRDALFAPAPTRLRFPLTLPDEPRLTFSYGLIAGSRFGDRVEFEVIVEHRGRVASVFRQEAEIGPAGADWHWHDAVVDLAAWSGDDVILELRTRSTTPRGFGLWGNPMIDAPRLASDPPNVVLIGIDTLRADRLSAYGYERPTSPNLDRLAGEGVRFAQAISASNWTAPSFASILTGLPAASHGVVNEEFAMNQGVETLAEGLRAGGWRTHAVVYKAALYGLGLDQGFDRWFNLPTSDRTAQTNLDKALTFLDTLDERRFFLFFHLDDPHQPFNQPSPFDREFGDPAARERLGFELPISIRNSGIVGCKECSQRGRPKEDFIRAAQDLYDGAVAYTDDRIGALIEALKQRGIYEDTVIAVVADHGEVIYDRFGLWGHGALHLADEMVHVPLIIKPAGHSPHAGRVVHTQVRTTDLAPTLLEAAGLPAEPEADSRSLWPLVAGDETGDRVAFFENPQRNVIGLRTSEWKYVVRTFGERSYRSLWDLKRDPGELVNLAADRPAETARLDELLASFLLRTRRGPFLLVIGDGEAGAFQLVVERQGEGGMRSIVGLPAQPVVGPDDRSFPGVGRVLALVRLDLAADHTARASLVSAGSTVSSVAARGGDIEPYEPDSWARLVSSPGVYLLRGAELDGATRIGPPANVDQVEDLRALGYIN